MEPSDELLGYVKASKNRRKVLHVLNEGKSTPAEITQKTQILFPNTSKILGGLVAKNLVQCTTSGLRKGKIFTLSPIGRAICEELNL